MSELTTNIILTLQLNDSFYELYGIQNLGLITAGDTFLQADITSWHAGINFLHDITDEGIFTYTIVKE